jgi:tellurite methyltransferase
VAIVNARSDVAAEFGDIDIYVFDQLHRGRITRDMRILDAGCGGGRNLEYMLKHGYDVWGNDASEHAIAVTRSMALRLAPSLSPIERFRIEPVEHMSFGDAKFDGVLSSAVMHFARDEGQWHAMLREMWRVLAPGGMFFARLATTIGHEARVKPLGNRRFIMPDGDERFLVDEPFIMAATRELGGALLDPLKTSVVQDRRSMMTWVVGKSR